MRPKFLEFLVALGTNPEVQASYEIDPEEAMRNAGLTQAEKSALRSRDSREIRRALRGGPVGSLTIAGAGFKPSHITPEAESAIRSAEKVFYLVPSRLLENWIRSHNASAESLAILFRPDISRSASYVKVARSMLDPAIKGICVTGVFYGHAGILMYPVHLALMEAKNRGIPAKMLPGISSADCLYAELGIDPGAGGCQSFDATDFLIHHRRFDPSATLLLWQVGGIGDVGHASASGGGLELLSRRLIQVYPSSHEVFLFETAMEPAESSRIEKVALQHLSLNAPGLFSTLLVRPVVKATSSPEMRRRLGMDQ